MLKNKEKSIPVKVYVRVRPLNDAEVSRGSRIIVECSPNSREIVVNERPSDKITRKFTFDKVFHPKSQQIDVYKNVAHPLIKEVLDGYNCTIFAYGQTGAGKTYTMEGRKSNNASVTWMSDPHAGIIPRAVGHLFDELRLLEAEYSVKASFLEIYNEEIFDLLSPIDDTNKLRLYDDAVKKGAVVVSGLDEIAVRNKEDVYAILDRGSRKRQTAATLMNAASSRSHTVFSVTIRIRENAVDENELVRTGKLNLVDLAGSENIGRSGAIEKRAREAGNINQSLLTLGRVITALVEKTPHVPYRESKLTRLLQESLGGRTKTCIIATISPSQCSMEETLSTLDYAHRAKNIQNKPEVNQKIGKAALIQEYIEEIQRLKTDLTAAREKNGIWLAQDHYNEMMIQIENQKKELSGLLVDVKTLSDTLERKEELNKELNESLQNYLSELLKTKNSLEESNIVLQHHVNTEQKLSKQAESLLSVADTATSDMNLLHETLGRKRQIEADNLAACCLVTDTTRNKLFYIQELISNVQENRLKSASEIITICDETREITDSRTQQLKNSVDNNLTVITEFLRVLQNSTGTMVSQAEEKTGTMKLVCSEFIQHNMDEISGFLGDILKRFEQVSKDITLFKNEHKKMNEHLAATFQEQERNLLKFFVSHKEHIRAVEEKLQQQEKILKSTKKSMIKQKNSMEKVTAAFQSYIKENSIEIDATSENVEESLSSLMIATKDLNNATSEMDSLNNYLESCRNNTKTLIDVSNERATSVVEGIQCFGSDVCQKIMDQKLDFSEKQMKYLGTVKGNLDSLSEVVLNYQCDQEKEVKKSDEHAHEFTVNHQKLVEQTKNEQMELVEKCKNCVFSDTEDLNTKAENASCNISECVQIMEKFIKEDIIEYIPSGNTPQRRELLYPRTLAATSPHERILYRFRAGKDNDTFMEPSTSSGLSSSERLQDFSSSSESSLSEGMQESVIDNNSSYSGRTEISESNLKNQIGKHASKSTSNIHSEISMLCRPSQSEPSLQDVLLNKENSSPKSVSGVKLQSMKRHILREHNE